MVRPGLVGLLVASIVGSGFSALHAQAVISNPVTTPTSTTSTSTTTNSSSTSPIDFSLISWRYGQLSPSFTPTSISSSATSTTTRSTGTVSTTSTNPFVAAALSLNGGLTVNPSSTASTTATTAATANATSAPVQRVVFSPRFVSLSSTTHDYGISNTISATQSSTNTTSTTFNNLLTLTNSPSVNLVAVPEPGTLLLCGSILAMVGYGYARRNAQKPAGKSQETEATNLEPETTT